MPTSTRRIAVFLQKSSANSLLPSGPTRVVGPYNDPRHPCRGGRLCPPAGYTGFTEICGEFAASRRADVGIGPYSRMRRCNRIRRRYLYNSSILPGGAEPRPYQGSVESACPANFERKAFLPQSFKRSYLQIWYTVTGGA